MERLSDPHSIFLSVWRISCTTMPMASMFKPSQTLHRASQPVLWPIGAALSHSAKVEVDSEDRQSASQRQLNAKHHTFSQLGNE